MEWDSLLSEERLGSKYKMPYDETRYPIRTIINSLLDKFVPAVFEYEEDNENYKQSKGERKLTDLISENYKRCYKLHRTYDD